MMKPKAQSEHEEGMLEYLEDIIGSSRFKEPIEQLANEVETLNEARGEKVISLIPDKGKHFRIKFFGSCLFVTLRYTIVVGCKKKFGLLPVMLTGQRNFISVASLL